MAVYLLLWRKEDNARLCGYAQINDYIYVHIYKAHRALSKVRRVYLTT